MEEAIHPELSLLITQQSVPILAGLVACGLLCCFFGYRTTHFLVDLSGFILFGMISMLAAGVIADGNILVMGIALLAGGIVGALLAHTVYRLGIMALGGGASALVMWHFSESLPNDQWLLPAIIAAMLLGGILSLFLQHLLVSTATAILGGLMVVHGMFMLLEYFEVAPTLPESYGSFSSAALFTMAWGTVSLTGFLFQMIFDRNNKRK